MTESLHPALRTSRSLSLIGTMETYDSQAEASRLIPFQWRGFLEAYPGLGSSAKLYGASPCTGDGRVHYLAGVDQEGLESSTSGERLSLEAGEYAFVQVSDPALLRDTWVWLLGTWLPASGRQERRAPEFERYSGISEAGLPVGPVEVWIPLEPVAGD